MAKWVSNIGMTPQQIADDPALQAEFEARVDRVGAVSGQVPALQTDGTLDFANSMIGVGVTRFEKLTNQAAYDAIVTKDANTVYAIMA